MQAVEGVCPGGLSLKRCLRRGKRSLSSFSEHIRGNRFALSRRGGWRSLQDGCKDGLSLIDDFQACFYRAEALLFGIVLDVLMGVPKTTGVLSHYFAQGGSGELSDHLLFPWRNRSKVSDQTMVRAMSKLVEKDGLVFGGNALLYSPGRLDAM